MALDFRASGYPEVSVPLEAFEYLMRLASHGVEVGRLAEIDPYDETSLEPDAARSLAGTVQALCQRLDVEFAAPVSAMAFEPPRVADVEADAYHLGRAGVLSLLQDLSSLLCEAGNAGEVVVVRGD